MPISPLHDQELAKTIVARTRSRVLLGTDWQFRLVKRDDQSAVPARGNCHFNKAETVRISAAFSALGCATIYGVSLAGFMKLEAVYRLTAGADALWRFNRECGAHNCALVDEAVSAMIICSMDDFFVAVGTPSFVADALGESEEAAYSTFDDYAHDPQMPAYFSRFLDVVRDSFRLRYPLLRDGEILTFPYPERATEVLEPR